MHNCTRFPQTPNHFNLCLTWMWMNAAVIPWWAHRRWYSVFWIMSLYFWARYFFCTFGTDFCAQFNVTEVYGGNYLLWIRASIRRSWSKCFRCYHRAKTCGQTDLTLADCHCVISFALFSCKGQATLCVQSVQYRTRLSEIAFLRTVLVWLSTCIPYQLNIVSDYAITQYRMNASDIAHLVRIVCSGLYTTTYPFVIFTKIDPQCKTAPIITHNYIHIFLHIHLTE